MANLFVLINRFNVAGFSQAASGGLFCTLEDHAFATTQNYLQQQMTKR